MMHSSNEHIKEYRVYATLLTLNNSYLQVVNSYVQQVGIYNGIYTTIIIYN